MKNKKGATMWCADCGVCVGNTEADMFNHICNTKKKREYKKYIKEKDGNLI